MTRLSETRVRRLPRRAFSSLPYVSLFGGALLIANIGLSFEEPHWSMLTLAGLLVIAAPLGLLIHLATTSEMTGAEERMWLCELVGRRDLLYSPPISTLPIEHEPRTCCCCFIVVVREWRRGCRNAAADLAFVGPTIPIEGSIFEGQRGCRTKS
jgi:hypothetical protein